MYCEVGDISTSFKGVISINEDILKQQAAGAEMRFLAASRNNYDA